MYRIVFSRRAEKSFLDLPQPLAVRVKEAIDKLSRDPHAHGTIKLENAPVAKYRQRVGDVRVLFDLDDARQIIAVLDIRKRGEGTYK